ncbi:MAG TPA: F0F1 ATP synthase subunit A [Balneolaceae bacterium]|nr:F0F1 ATP synthase subunit A [Balneolaceae bacterium]
MEITTDHIIFWEWEFIHINATLVYSWGVMTLLVVGSWLVSRRLSSGTKMSRWQNLLEVLVTMIQDQIREASRQEPRHYLPFIGTLFLFILVSNIIDVIPGVSAPTSSLSTTAALASCVFVAVPVFGIAQQGLRAYLAHYTKPSLLMLPFNIIGELSRTIALAIRLFGNMMSGSLIVAILLSLAPLFFPVLVQAFGLLIGVIQAYVFSILALVYIASGQRVKQHELEEALNEDISPEDQDLHENIN